MQQFRRDANSHTWNVNAPGFLKGSSVPRAHYLNLFAVLQDGVLIRYGNTIKLARADQDYTGKQAKSDAAENCI